MRKAFWVGGICVAFTIVCVGLFVIKRPFYIVSESAVEPVFISANMLKKLGMVETPLTLKINTLLSDKPQQIPIWEPLRLKRTQQALIDVSLCGDSGIYRPDGLAQRFSEQKAARDGTRSIPVDCGMIKTSIPFSF